MKYSFLAASKKKPTVGIVLKQFHTSYLENTLSHVFSKFDLPALGTGLAHDLLV